jgi:hypothetical protein
MVGIAGALGPILERFGLEISVGVVVTLAVLLLNLRHARHAGVVMGRTRSVLQWLVIFLLGGVLLGVISINVDRARELLDVGLSLV